MHYSLNFGWYAGSDVTGTEFDTSPLEFCVATGIATLAVLLLF